MTHRLNVIYPFAALLLGMFVTQILATVHVYLSNAQLLESLKVMKAAGYLTIPNQKVMQTLTSFVPAFCGGLFFTLSIGAGISFISLVLAWVWDRLFSRSKYILYLFLSMWLFCLIALNFRGFKAFVSLYFLITPALVFAYVAKILFHSDSQSRQRNELIHIFPVCVLALFLSWQADTRMFSDFRDIFLLSNSVGSGINNFYYKYNLYPAEVFKSLDQKMLKTCRVVKKKETAASRLLEDILTDHDYLPIEGETAVDLLVAQIDSGFVFENQGEPILRISSAEFFADPQKALKSFAIKSDTHTIFRRVTFLFLLMGLPLAVYVIGHGLFFIGFSLFLKTRTSTVIASGICFGLCLILLFFFHLNRTSDVSIKNLPEALNSDRWQKRVAALKIIAANGLEIKNFKAYPKLLNSTYIAERYWFIRTLSRSQSPATYRDLLYFLDDSNPNVLRMTLFALGRRGKRQAIPKIIDKIMTSNDWYSQWYAYRALRNLGWKQPELK